MNYSSLSKLKSHINSSVVLIFFTILALVCANTPIVKEWYFSLWQLPMSRFYTFKRMYLVICKHYRFMQIAKINNGNFAHILSDSLQVVPRTLNELSSKRRNSPFLLREP